MASVAEVHSIDHSRRNRASAGAWVFAILLVTASVGLFLTLDASQRFEARIAEMAIAAVLDTGTRIDADGTSVLVGLGGHRAFALHIGIACSVVLLIVPFLLVAAAMLASGRASVWRAIPAVVLGAALLLAVNAARLVLIAHLTMQDGLDGFGWAHTVYGSAVVLVGLILVILAFLAVMAIGRRRTLGRDSSS
ncbi:archaeosortase/exosortase family protein [Microbacterium resistens]|uniref:Archaeosortase/exosortase family protein n=1 Tax=Microbacterium resistens TaxID=156977 RepID=A0ABY3RR47_9MICO|nr:archaeosortase/exosortase family protein [Microbacterium resistens]UGS24967.1 archaeosortase/exosortase family protein [Microbacterium resistens]